MPRRHKAATLPGSLASDLSRASCALIKGRRTQKEKEEETQGGNSPAMKAELFVPVNGLAGTRW